MNLLELRNNGTSAYIILTVVGFGFIYDKKLFLGMFNVLLCSRFVEFLVRCPSEFSKRGVVVVAEKVKQKQFL